MFVVRWNNEPRCVTGAGSREHVLVGAHVVIPVRPFLDISGSKLPALFPGVNALQQSRPLLVSRLVQEEL